MDLNKELEELKAQMTPMNTIKFLGGTLVALGATAAVIGIMKGGLKGARGVTKLLMKLGIFVLACKAGDTAEDYFREKVTEFMEDSKEAKKEIKEIQEIISHGEKA